MKLDKLKSDNGDEYVLRKAAEVLQVCVWMIIVIYIANCLKETRQMIPDCTRRLNKAIDELSNAIDSIDKQSIVNETSGAGVYTNACEQLTIAKQQQRST